MKTPIVRVFRSRGEDLLFYDERKFREFAAKQKKKFDKKYYKGLGTTKPEDVPDTFGMKMVEYVNDEDAAHNMNKVFHKKYADARKLWLSNYNPNHKFSLDDTPQFAQMQISDFIDGEMIKFSLDDCKRSIPSGIDGLKESQRKILYAVKKRNLRYSGKSLKVAQLGGYVAEHTNYHHGEQNLYETITKMANEFPGTNNIPLLYRDGMFGCVDPSTPILLWNGSTKRADEIVVGDILIGDNGSFRTVRELTEGEDEMYDIIQEFGDTYRVNSHHILTLYYSGHKIINWEELSKSWTLSYFDTSTLKVETKTIRTCKWTRITKTMGYSMMLEYSKSIPAIFDINVQQYLKLPKSVQRYFKGIKNYQTVRWGSQDVPIDPYTLGTWLGDQNGNGKQVPHKYIINDEKTRLELLAGFIDSSDSVVKQGVYNIKISDNLIDSMKYIAQSLGFRTHISVKTLVISGNVCKIPVRLTSKKIYNINKGVKSVYYDINVVHVGKGKFNGWDIDGNERFLLGDFTITHNTRISGGKDAASARYIFTKMDMLTQLLFRPEDDVLLEQNIDDGDVVEPKFYVPILPMITINGCVVGIGTGWSCNVPGFNPLDLIASVKVWLEHDGEVLIEDPDDNTIVSLLPELTPWYRDFKGKIESVGNDKYITYGVCEEGPRETTIVSELPIGLWTDKFKESLEDYVENKQIKNMKNYSTPKKVNFVLTEATDGFKLNEDNLKLYSYLYTSNMVLFNDKEQLRKFSSVDEIINYFCGIRFEYYIRRKKYLLNELEIEVKFLGNKERFIREVMDKSLNIMNIPEKDVIIELEKRAYDKEAKNDNEDYDYLLRMQVRTFTAEKVKKLKNDISSKLRELKTLKATSEKTMWINDLNEFETHYKEFLKVMASEKPKITKKRH